MKVNYNNKVFKPVSNSDNGEVSGETTFHYQQSGQIVTANYAGGDIIKGSLIALVDDDGCLDMRYQHVNKAGVLQTGTCQSRPERLPDNRIRLHERWQWTSGDHTQGSSILEEFPMD